MDGVRDRLVEVARRGETITYDQLRDECGLDGDIVPMLRALSEAEDDAGHGLLTAVVVRADTARPGAGWTRLAAARGRDVSDPDAAWTAERERLRRSYAGDD